MIATAPIQLVTLGTKPVDPKGGPRRAKWKSASQVDTFGLLDDPNSTSSCQRKWGFRTIEGLKASNQFAQAGTAYHELIDPWLRSGTPLPDDDTGKRILAGLHFLPPPGVAEVEREFWLRSPVAVYNGKVDWAFREDASKPWPTGPGSGLWVVGDNKSTSDLKWAKTPAQLLEDVQAMIYATEAFVRFPEEDRLELRWTYFQRKGARKSIQVRNKDGSPVVVTRAHAFEQFARIDATAAEMCKIELSGARAHDLPPNASACDAFGGCPYRDVCNLTPQERMKSIMAQESLRERMLKRNAEKGGAAPAATAPAASTPAPTAAAAAPKKPAGFPVRKAGTDGINPPEAPEVIAPTGEAEAPKASSSGKEKGTCSCGAVVFLDAAGKLEEHKRKGGFRCPGTGKAPLPEEAAAQLEGEETITDPAAVAAVQAEAAAVQEEKKPATVTRFPTAKTKPAEEEERREVRPPEVAAEPGELSTAEENAMIVALLEEMDAGVVRAARKAIKRLRSM